MKKSTVLIALILLLVTGTLYGETFVLPSVVHSPGANGAFWKTAIGVYNGSSSYQTIEAHEFSGLGSVPSAGLPPGGFLSNEELGALFNLGEGTFLVKIITSDPGVVFSARTYSVPIEDSALGSAGQYSTILTPLKPVDGEASFAFTRIRGARKAIFLYGSLSAACAVSDGSTIYTYYSTIGQLTRYALPEDAVACKVTAHGFPSGSEDTLSYAWGTEADNLTNCPTLFNAE